jgi:hypothetical protein
MSFGPRLAITRAMENLDPDVALEELEYRLQELQAQRMRAEALFNGYAGLAEDDDEL